MWPQPHKNSPLFIIIIIWQIKRDYFADPVRQSQQLLEERFEERRILVWGGYRLLRSAWNIGTLKGMLCEGMRFATETHRNY